jgi:ATP-dependent helicase HrpA
LKLRSAPTGDAALVAPASVNANQQASGSGRLAGGQAASTAALAAAAGTARPAALRHTPRSDTAHGPGHDRVPEPSAAEPPHYTHWTFGELPELMEVRKGGHVLVGFPALIDRATHVEIEVFDEPEVAAQRHRAGLRRLVALQIRDALKYLEKNIPDLHRMEIAYMPLGGAAELREQIVELTLDRAFLADPLPTDAAAFTRRVEEGRTRINLICSEIARSVAIVLQEYNAVMRKLKDTRPTKEVADDIAAQLARLLPRRFITATPWEQFAHLPRYLKAVVLRLEKLRADPQRDAQRMSELRPLEQRWLRHVAERKGAPDARLEAFRWLLEELRVSLFAQELRTPQPVSVKRLERAWAELAR